MLKTVLIALVSQVLATPTKTNKPFPSLTMLTPKSRPVTVLDKASTSICGDTQAGSVYFESSPGSRNLIGWKVDQPSLKGNCTLRIADSPQESHLKTLTPLDGSADEHGSFPCGRIDTGFEAKEVRLPSGVSCDSCIL